VEDPLRLEHRGRSAGQPYSVVIVIESPSVMNSSQNTTS
jgi:hypothetical protein